jgi:DNA-binding XRE family transcriptional regulator
VTPIERLKRNLNKRLPEATVELDSPAKETGRWYLDVELDGHGVIVAWSPRHGFGVSSSEEYGYGEGHDEVYRDARKVLPRVIELLQEKRRTRPPRSVLLRDIREMADLTQVELARRLGVNQAAVSKLERRSDMTLGKLAQIIEALGGRMEVLAKFPDEVVKIGQFDDDVGDAA